MAVIATLHRSGRMADRIKYRDHLIASFVHRRDGEEFTVVRAPGRTGKLQMHASWRCRGFDSDAAKAWVDEQLDQEKSGQASNNN